MCEFLSFVIETGDRGRIYFGDKLDSHEGIEAKHGLKPSHYREAEWTKNTDESLTVRVESGENENIYRAMILGDYGSRENLLDKLYSGKIGDVNLSVEEKMRITIEGGNLNYVRTLVEDGVDITANNNQAVQLASSNGHLEVVKYLVSQGADITANNNQAVQLASSNGYLEVVKYLESIMKNNL